MSNTAQLNITYEVIQHQEARYACALLLGDSPGIASARELAELPKDGVVLAAVGPLYQSEADALTTPEAIATRIDRAIRTAASDTLVKAQWLESEIANG